MSSTCFIFKQYIYHQIQILAIHVWGGLNKRGGGDPTDNLNINKRRGMGPNKSGEEVGLKNVLDQKWQATITLNKIRKANHSNFTITQ